MKRLLFRTSGGGFDGHRPPFAYVDLDEAFIKSMREAKAIVDAQPPRVDHVAFSGNCYWPDSDTSFVKIYEAYGQDFDEDINESGWILEPVGFVRPEWEEERIEGEYLVASTSGFWWKARQKHSDLEFETTYYNWEVLDDWERLRTK